MKQMKQHPQLRESYPEFTLTELCAKAGITPPIMKKYQMLLKLGSGEKKGDRTYYSQTQVKVYKRVKELRVAGIEYDEIVELFFLEDKLSEWPYDGDVANTHDEEFQPCTNCWLAPVFDVFGSQPFKEDWRKDPKLEPLISQHMAIKKRIVRKAKETEACMKQLILNVEPDEDEDLRRQL